MKIRLSYVSNSSSSSFLIIYKSFQDFMKFLNFAGFERFKEDFEKQDVCSSLEYLEGFIDKFFFAEMEAHFDFKMMNNAFDDAYDLLEISGVSFDEYYKCIKPITDLVEKYIKIIPKIQDVERKCRTDYLSIEEEMQIEQWKRPAWNEYMSKDFKNKLNQNKKEFAKKLLDALTKKGYQIKCLSYEDHTKEGAYMERCFMPFIGQNPERNYQIFIANNH